MKITEKEVQGWVMSGLNYKMIEYCKEFAHSEAGLKRMTTSQIRKFFGEVKRIEADFEQNKDAILMLEPRLAYTCGRQSGKAVKPLYEMFKLTLADLCKPENQTQEKFNRFVKVIECIVAFHKEVARN